MSRFALMLLGGLGRVLIGLGALTMLFAFFQLWGTGLAEARAQNDLQDEFRARLAEVSTNQNGTDRGAGVTGTEDAPGLEAAGAPGETTELAAAAPGPPPLTPDQLPEAGAAMGVIDIPAIGVTKTIVEGTTRDILRDGPGHYENTPFPGQPGNAAIAGHRTTHGAPFFDIDLLQPGDEILVETLQGRFTYVVDAHDDGAGNQLGHFIVAPTEVGVIADSGDNRLTLTACHPKYSARERIIVTATLTSEPAPAGVDIGTDLSSLPDEDRSEMAAAAETLDGGIDGAEGPVDELAATTPDQPVPSQPAPGEASDIEGAGSAGFEQDNGDPTNTIGDDSTVTDSLGWQPQYLGPTGAWAALTAAIVFGGWAAGRMWRRWPAYGIALAPFVWALFFCFTNLDKYLPAV